MREDFKYTKEMKVSKAQVEKNKAGQTTKEGGKTKQGGSVRKKTEQDTNLQNKTGSNKPGLTDSSPALLLFLSL